MLWKGMATIKKEVIPVKDIIQHYELLRNKEDVQEPTPTNASGSENIPKTGILKTDKKKKKDNRKHGKPKPPVSRSDSSNSTEQSESQTDAEETISSAEVVQSPLPLNFDFNSYNKRRGIVTMLGPMFEIKMCTLIFLKLLSSSSQFHLCSNIDGAGEFDDIVFSYKTNDENSEGRVVTVFMQLKHVEHTDIIRSVCFLKQRNISFTIRKYLKSFSDLKKITYPLHPIFGTEIHNRQYVIYTNGDISRELFFEENGYTHNAIFFHMNKGTVLSLKYENIHDIEKYKEYIDCVKCIIQENEEDAKEKIKQKSESITDSVTNQELINRIETLRNLPTISDIKKTVKEDESIDVELFKSFFESVKFYCLQYDNSILDKIIKQEIRFLLHTTSSETENTFIKLSERMKQWWEKENYYLTENADIWKDIVKESQSSQFLPRIRDLEKLRVKFVPEKIAELEEQLKCRNGIVNIVSQGNSTVLSSIKLLQTVNLKFSGKYLFISLNDCISKNCMIWEIWPNWWCQILIIECKSEILIPDWVLNRICTTLRNFTESKVIFISTQGHNLRHLFQEKQDIFSILYSEYFDKAKLSDLEEEAKKFLLEKDVNFQGCIVKLKSILHKNDNIESDDLAAIVMNEVITAGEDLSDIKLKYYVQRYLKQPVFSKNVFRILDSDVTFVFSEQDKIKISSFIEINEPIQDSVDVIYKYSISVDDKMNNLEMSDRSVKFVSLTDRNEYQEFETLSKILPNIYYIKCEGEDIYLQKAKGDITRIISFSNAKSRRIKQNDLLEHIKNSCSIITADPGMGKTTLLNHVALEIKKRYPSLYVALISLPKYCEFLRNINVAKIDENVCTKFILKSMNSSGKINPLSNLFAKNLNRCIILIDAFDEVSPDYSRKVQKIVNYFNDKACGICMTSRSNMKEYLEKKLSLLSYTLEPMNKENQVQFLKNFWLSKNENLSAEDAKKYAEGLLHKYAYSLNDNNMVFTGIPFHGKMLAEIFEENMKHYLPDDLKKYSGTVNILQMFERFIENKIKLYFQEKKESNLSSPIVRKEFQMFRAQFLENYKHLAVIHTFKDKQTDNSKMSELKSLITGFLNDISHGEERTGLMVHSNDRENNFIHHSFCEYFFALWLADNYEKEKNFIVNKLFNEKMQVVRKFLDFKLSEGFQLHTAVLTNDLKNVSKLIGGEDINKCDKGGRTVLHLAAAYNYHTIVYTLILNKVPVNATDNVNLTAIQYAERSQSWDALEILLNHGAYVNDLMLLSKHEDFKKKRRQIYMDALYISCANGLVTLLELIMKYFTINGNQVFKRPSIRKSKLYGSSNAIIRRESHDREKFIPLITCAEHGQRNVLKLLCNRTVNIDVADRAGNTALMMAASQGHIGVVTHLINRKADVNKINNFDESALMKAAKYGHYEIVKYLIEKGANISQLNKNGMSVLMRAVMIGNFEIVKFLCDNGSDINLVNNFGESALTLSIREGYLDIVKFLVERGAKTNNINRYGHTALIFSMIEEQYDIANYFVKDFENINKFDNNGISALILAVQKGDINLITLLIENGADINCVKDNGDSALMWAVSKGYYDIVDYLCMNGAHLHYSNAEGKDAMSISKTENYENICNYLSGKIKQN